ncbi:tetratricopeptide repeat protein [Flavobacterium cerinum]|uniref:Tetratricopeptide repeat protein n=1 Tax=Flavobacterium cerinum TaxID=2502784 RepID=A0ABY5J1D6_9FLAO|nr:tetratricopeptide repeat protein [Flavobacterium cerinum]UUC47374.1 tetratricopeptide repeat protein [Flavobacterium cerinum]
MNGQNFSVQLKSHAKLASGKPITAKLERSTINLYLAILEPVLIIYYIAEHDEAYYCWFTEKTVDLTKKNKSFTISFNSTNKLSSIDWNTISSHIEEIFSRRFLLHSFPEHTFSEMGIEEKEASAHFIKGDFTSALHIYYQLQKKSPSAHLLNSIALCHYELYQYKDALKNINEALAIIDSSTIRLNKASILTEYGIESGNKAMVLEASTIFKSSLDENEDYNQHYNYANTLRWLGYYDEAKKHLKIALDKNPNYAEAWKNLGEIYSKKGDTDKEINCYKNALAINPKLAPALMSMGIALIREMQNFDEGIKYLEKAVMEDPDLFSKFSTGYFWLSFANFGIDQNSKGEFYLSQGLTHYPGDPYLLNLKRNLFVERWHESPEKKRLAKEFMLFRLNFEPNDTIALECLCKIYFNDGENSRMFELIKNRTVLFQNTSTVEFIESGFDLEPFLSSIRSYGDYCSFWSCYLFCHKKLRQYSS